MSDPDVYVVFRAVITLSRPNTQIVRPEGLQKPEIVPGQPVACNFGQLPINHGLHYRARYFRIIKVSTISASIP